MSPTRLLSFEKLQECLHTEVPYSLVTNFLLKDIQMKRNAHRIREKEKHVDEMDFFVDCFFYKFKINTNIGALKLLHLH